MLPNDPRTPSLDPLEMLAAEAYGDIAVTAVIRPAAILPEDAARQVLVELAHRDARAGGTWVSTPSTWQRYDRPWDDAFNPGASMLLGTMHIAYGVPTRYDITIYRATITRIGHEHGWTVESLCDDALAYGGYSLEMCPRASLAPPPRPFKLGA
jgi:hypothetical protein